MKEHNDIDRLFRESFKDFEVEAPENAWGNIEKQLKASKRPIVPLWQKISAAAAVVAIVIVAGSQWFIGSQITNSNGIVVDSPKGPQEESFSRPENALNQSEDSFVTSSGDNNRRVNSATQNTNSREAISTAVVSSSSVQPNRSSVAGTNTSVKVLKNPNQLPREIITQFLVNKENTLSEGSDLIALSSKPALGSNNTLRASGIEKAQTVIEIEPKLESLVEVAQQIYNEDQNTTSSTEKKSWFVKPQISPTFYGNMGSGSAIDENLAQNSGSGDVNVSFGVNLAYQLNDKMKIRSGINRVNLNYSTNDVFVVPGMASSGFNNANINSSYQASILTEQQMVDLNTAGVLGRIPTETSQLQQQLGFIEIPMELEYKLLDKGININIIGGASTFLLNQNSLDISTGNTTTSIGEANNLNDISFSTNFALGFDYDISERLMLNLEPTFKYQINTFQSGTTDFQPYFFGIYSGVIFKF
jgi:hypothetical protein